MRAPGLDPEAIDASFVPRARGTISGVDLDGEAVLYDEATGRLHHLSPHATLVWSCFDGRASVAELVADLSEAYGVHGHVIEADVLTLTRQLARRGLLEDVGPVEDLRPSANADGAEGVPLVIPEPPSPARDELDRLSWAGTTTFRIGPWYVGVRCSTREVEELLRRALPAHVADGVETPPNYSVVAALPPKSHRSPRELHFLYRSQDPVIRSRTLSRLVRGLLSHLSAHLEEEPDPLLRVRGVPLVAGTTAILAPRELLADLGRIEPRLRQEGVRVLDLPYATVDPATAELVVPPPAVEHDPDVLEELDVVESPTRPEEEGAVVPGRYPIKAWVLSTGDTAGPLPVATALAGAFPALVDPSRIGVRRGFAELAGLLARTTPVRLSPTRPADLARRLRELARA